MRNLLCRYLHAHIAPGYHDAVARLNDGINIFNSFFILDFRDNLHSRTFFIQNLPDLADRIGIADERSRHKIKACIHAETNVFLIFIGQRRKLDPYSRYIDTLLLAQLAAIFNPADDVIISCNEVNHTALAFVAPVDAYDRAVAHNSKLLIRFLPQFLFYLFIPGRLYAIFHVL